MLPSTHATKIILADKDQHTSNIIKEIKDIGGSIQKVSYSGNKSEIDFEWEGKSRKVIFYHLEIDKNSIDKLMGEVGHYDVYFEKKSQDLGSPEILEKFMGNLKNGGHAVLDYDADNHIGLEKEPLDKKYDGEDYWYGHHRMKIYRKQRNVRGMGLRLNLNRTLSDAEYTRNGGILE